MESVNAGRVEAVVLAGGLGTRLRPVVSDLPKPMAPVGGRPFLAYVMDHLISQGIGRIVLATGYKHDVIEGRFGSSYRGIPLHYSVEAEPLGTGGAIKQALEHVRSELALICNGDTLHRFHLAGMLAFHTRTAADMTLCLKPMERFDRYGSVELAGHRIARFLEKSARSAGLVNCGVYMANSGLIREIGLPDQFSFEREFLEARVGELNLCGFVSEAYFVDMGIPEDYARAQRELALP
ncbi:nucleotidyltransferase family protein [Paenibacillus thalictri]|uniref:D-glycero-D-manno-heptose 1-phosphate guanosyltransferase n=1 Tax=Paenibacillus thalictri TaxID=2527873 RepID=A0A4Q9E0T2_9BACL|nr:nucleotidyltransferase family protein [Paenibacillus thalictri]TBL81753.1 D-glycero-D-manno-heptose 1-phosphate guanosyltransferase [Paenibacillus thalictri]